MKRLILITTLAILPAFATLSTTANASRLRYSGGINNCNHIGQGPVIKNSPGTIITIHASGLAMGQGHFWILIFNKTTAPVEGDVPAIAFPLSQVIDRDYLGGLPMTTGISWAISDSPATLNTVCAYVYGTLTVTYQ